MGLGDEGLAHQEDQADDQQGGDDIHSLLIFVFMELTDESNVFGSKLYIVLY